MDKAQTAPRNPDFFKRHKKVSQIIYILVLVCYAAVQIYLAISAYQSLSEKISILAEINANWNTSPITDIQAAATCATGYESLYTYDWPGVVKGCDCSDITTAKASKYSISAVIGRGGCSSNMTLAGCVAVSPITATSLEYIGKTSNPMKLCVKRDSTTSFAKGNSKASSQGVCPSGTKKCITSTDSEIIYCVPTASNCPITSLTFQESACAGGSTNFINYNSVGITRSVVYSTTTAALPIVEFRLYEMSMCSLKDTQNIRSGRTKYALRGKKRSNCASDDIYWNHKEYAQAARIREGDLYDYHGLKTSIQALLDITTYIDFTSVADAKNPYYGLYSRSYVAWDSKCSGKLERLARHLKRSRV